MKDQPQTLNQILSVLATVIHDRLENGDSVDVAVLSPVDQAKQAIQDALNRSMKATLDEIEPKFGFHYQQGFMIGVGILNDRIRRELGLEAAS